MTVRVASGEAGRWTAIRRVLVAGPDDEAAQAARDYDVESARAYGDRLVLKLRGIDSASEADRLKGYWILAPGNEVPALPEGVFYVARLVGLEAFGEEGEHLGKVTDVVETGGTDLLVVAGADGEELLIPMASSIVLGIDEAAGRLTVRLPEGLREAGRR